MRKLGLLLVVSILLFVFGCGTFVYELSQISPNQIDLSKETQTMTRCRESDGPVHEDYDNDNAR